MALAANTLKANSTRAAFVADFPAGSHVRYYTGAVPAATAAATGTVVADVPLPASPWDVSVDGVASKGAAAWTTTTKLAGTPTYGRIVDAAGTKWSQFVIGVDGTASAVATAGDAYTITAFTVTFPG